MDSKGLIPRNKGEQSSDIVNKLNTILASMQVLYNNIHAAHWNLECSDFLFLHTYFDEIYEATGVHIDKYAEYVRIQGSFPIHTYKEYLSKSLVDEVTFEETNEKISIFKKMISDTKIIQKYLKKAFKETEQFPGINDYIASSIDDLGKRLWFFNASTKDK